ncbi:MAG: rhodanese-like domain-containing protein [Gemmatimonadota bacterium]|jgi:thiosulfate/3-mercaptopyruvate sulfurtransferase
MAAMKRSGRIRKALGVLVLVVPVLVAVAGVRYGSAARKVPPVVSVDWLASHLEDPNLVLLHVGDETEYADAHLPGALHVKLDDISTPHEDEALVLELPAVETLRSKLESWGISDNSTVVVYWGNDWVSPTTRLVFTLDYMGLGQETAVLDGGMPAWRTAGHALTAAVPAPRRGRLTPRAPRAAVVADAAFVQSHARAKGWTLIDARNTRYYEGGEGSRDTRPGHIPGAVSLPFDQMVTEDLHVLPERELRAKFAAAGVAPGDSLIAYCHIGQQATVVVFAARLLGHPVRLYDGSYQDWQKRTELPVTKEPTKKGSGG